MTILLTIYLAGMPLSLIVLLWALEGVPTGEVGGAAGVAAAAIWVLLWPVFFVVCLYTAITER